MWVFSVFSVLNSEKRDQQCVRRANISTQFHGPILEVRCPAAANPLCSAFKGDGKSETLASPRKGVSMENLSKPFSRRTFLAGTSSLGAFYAATKLAPLQGLDPIPNDPRISQTPVVDKGFADAFERRIPGGERRGAADRRIPDSHRRVVPDGRAADGYAGTGPRGDQYALPFRSYPRKFVLWRRGCANLGARESGVAHDGILSQVASGRPRYIPRALGTARARCEDRQPARTREERRRRHDRHVHTGRPGRPGLAQPSSRSS